jgi:hypothetical protein
LINERLPVATSKTIKLSDPIPGHKEVIAEISLREPKFGDVMELGDPIDFVRTADGHQVRTINYPVVGEYAERCVDGIPPLLLNELGLQDALAVQEAIIDFFVQARLRLYTDASPQNSSSISVSMPAA